MPGYLYLDNASTPAARIPTRFPLALVDKVKN
jgi:hypothetical protein